MSTPPQAWTGRSKGTPLGYRIFHSTIRLLGVRAAYAMLYFVVPWYVVTARSSNAALRHYFGIIERWDPTIRGLSLWASYMAFGRMLVDRAAMRSGLGHRLKWTHKGEENLEAMIKAGKGGVAISAHVGNWELAGHLLQGLHGGITLVLLQAEDARIQQVSQAGTGNSYETIALGNDLSHVFRMDNALRSGRVLCLHGDRSLPGSRTRTVRFLGENAEFPLGPFALAAARQVPVCITFVARTGVLTYAFRCTPPIPAGTSAAVIMDRYVEQLEQVVRQYPLQWFNYFDFWGHGASDRQR